MVPYGAYFMHMYALDEPFCILNKNIASLDVSGICVKTSPCWVLWLNYIEF